MPLPRRWRLPSEDEALGTADTARQAEHDSGWLAPPAYVVDQHAEPRNEEPAT